MFTKLKVMKSNSDNKIFLSYCGGLLGLFSGGIMYNAIWDLYQIYWKKSRTNLRLPDNLKDIKVSNFINYGGLLGGILGVSFGYYGKPLIPLLLEQIKNNNDKTNTIK